MKWLAAVLVPLAVVALAVGCEEEKEEAATATPSPAAAATGTAHRTPSADATPTPEATPTLSPVQAVETICLEVQQSYPDIEEEVSEPIAETVRDILAGLGLQVVSEGTPCDATLTFALTGEALSAFYGPVPPDRCYTGAEVNGQMTLTMPGRAPLTLPISERKRPTQGLITDCPTKVHAPFDWVWPRPVLDGLASLWPPPQVFVQALGDEDWDVRRAAALALRDIGPDAKEAVPALIQALGDEGSGGRLPTALALEAITGQDFGEDAERWQQWWEEQE